MAEPNGGRRTVDPRSAGREGLAKGNHTPINVIGLTLPGAQVTLDQDGDGFDDGSTTAGAVVNGRNYALSAGLVVGVNIRNQATKALEALGDSAEPALRKALAGTSSVEFRRRVDQLLDRLVGAEPLRHARALETLESAGDTDSRRLLAALSNGAPQARLTEEARASLDRLGPTPRKSK